MWWKRHTIVLNWYERLNCGVEDSWESLDCKEIIPVNPKGNQAWIFIGRTDAEAEVLILWPQDVKSQLIGKDHDAGKDKGRRRTGQQRMRWLDDITDLMKMTLSKLQEIVQIGKSGMLYMELQILGHDFATEQQWS